ncbi:MAG: hypothetical protein E4H26_01790 [Flavobacteriales bacterium]|nr:MAG: hypothetical protein E4H26_01790 [Flavobacteriales bacterium]
MKENFRKRPKGSYIHEADWQQLYLLTENWKSDLEFYRDDLRFLQNMIDKYFKHMVKKESLDEVRDIEMLMVESGRDCDRLLKRTNTHLSHLGDLIDDLFKYDSHVFRKEHEKLEDDIADFVKEVRKNRIDVFTITEHVLETEKLGQLLKQ